MAADTWGLSWGGSTGSWLASWSQSRTAVPDVDDPGTSQAAAEALITGEGLVAAVNTAYSSTVPVGEVISQSPAPGTLVAPGSTVTITVSLGPLPVAANQPAGRKTRKHRYFVEIDGQVFHAEDSAHAQAILDHAADLAHAAATKQAEGIAKKANRARRIGMATPKIKTDAPINIRPYQKRIHTAYRNAAIEVEMRLHLALLAMREDDEAAAMLLL